VKKVEKDIKASDKKNATFVTNLDAGLISRNANDRGRFVVIKTKLTTKGRKECKGRGDYIYVARG
jgi:hypothetical protein